MDKSTTTIPPACEIKRICEIWTSGLYSREDMLENAEAIFPRHGVAAYPKLLRALADGTAFSQVPELAEYNETLRKKLEWREEIREGAASTNPLMRKWRERQMYRCFLEVGQEQNTNITHLPGAFELTRGCSVNCWFCALSAGPLTGVFRRTPENVELWRGVQEAMRDVVGPAAGWSAAYWATEPLDNREYEAFCLDFHEIHGVHPQTTTAVPLRDPERIRNLLAASTARGCLVNRFSVHSGEQLRQIHAEFSPWELRDTELILENDEASIAMVRAGRLFDLDGIDPEQAKRENERTIEALMKKNPSYVEQFSDAFVNTSYLTEHAQDSERLCVNLPGTTACVTGFLVNMVDRSVKLISPCAADSEWPLGYRVHDERGFSTVQEFRSLLEDMIEKNMGPEKVEPGHRITPLRRVNFRTTDKGFIFSTVFGKIYYEHEELAPYLAYLGELIWRGGMKAGEIALECFYVHGKNEAVTMAFINDAYAKGLIEIDGRPAAVMAPGRLEPVPERTA